VQAETEVIASITYQSLFRRFKKLAAMSGTAQAEAEEFGAIYGLKVVDVPSVLPLARVDIASSVYKTADGKWRAALAELLKMHDLKRPVLVGTTSVETSELFAAELDRQGIAHELLNAAPEAARREAEIIAQEIGGDRPRSPEIARDRPRSPEITARSIAGGARGCDHHLHQHGRPRHGHSPRRQPRLHGEAARA